VVRIVQTSRANSCSTVLTITAVSSTSTAQIRFVGAFRQVFESPQMGVVLETCLARVNHQQQFRFADLALLHPQGGVSGQNHRPVETCAKHEFDYTRNSRQPVMGFG